MLKNFLNEKRNRVVVFLCFNSLVSFAQENDDSWSRDIEPPPTPIDGSIVYLAIAALLLALYFFYKTNLKTGTK